MIIEPFLTYYRDSPDYNQSDKDREFNSVMTRNQATIDFLEGKETASYLLDVLESEDIDPVMYVESVDEAIRFMLENPHLNLHLDY